MRAGRLWAVKRTSTSSEAVPSRARALPTLEASLRSAEAPRDDFCRLAAVFFISGLSAAETLAAENFVRRQIAYYASSAAFQQALGYHGGADLAAELAALAWTGQWQPLAERLPQEFVEAVAIRAEPADLLEKIKARYAGLADRVCLQWGLGSDALMAAIAPSR